MSPDNRKSFEWSIWIAAFLLVGGGARAFGRVPAPERCAGAKVEASVLAVSAQVRCQAKAVSKGAAVAPKCLQRAESELRGSFAKADSKGACLGDAGATEAAYNPTGTRELESILLKPCANGPCIDPIFGSTANGRYWSRTADVNRSVDAWYVDFSAGEYANLLKREPLFVRAVR